jgi:hypothetical protein
MSNGKGDKARPVDRRRYEEEWQRIFRPTQDYIAAVNDLMATDFLREDPDANKDILRSDDMS